MQVAGTSETTANSAVNNQMSASWLNEISNTAFSESVSKSLVNQTLKDCTIEKTETIKDRVFAMVSYDVYKAREEAKAAQREEAL